MPPSYSRVSLKQEQPGRTTRLRSGLHQRRHQLLTIRRKPSHRSTRPTEIRTRGQQLPCRKSCGRQRKTAGDKVCQRLFTRAGEGTRTLDIASFRSVDSNPIVWIVMSIFFCDRSSFYTTICLYSGAISGRYDCRSIRFRNKLD